MKNQTPFFVYGSLLEGFYNYNAYLNGLVENIENATVEGGIMFSLGAFPAVVRGDEKIIGQVMYPYDYAYDHAKNNLDMLEGYSADDEENSMYLRRLTTVTLENGEKIEAYMYWWNGSLSFSSYVEGGSWAKYDELENEKVELTDEEIECIVSDSITYVTDGVEFEYDTVEERIYVFVDDLCIDALDIEIQDHEQLEITCDYYMSTRAFQDAYKRSQEDEIYSV